MATPINPDHFDGGQNLARGERRFDDDTLAELLINLQKRFPDEGGIAEWYVNDTGAATVKGTIVEASTSVDNGVKVADASSDHAIGVFFDDGIADGEPCRVIVSGRAQVLLKNSTAAASGNWVKVSDAAGRADASTTGPPGADPSHWLEIGHCHEANAGGIDQLVYVSLHFN